MLIQATGLTNTTTRKQKTKQTKERERERRNLYIVARTTVSFSLDNVLLIESDALKKSQKYPYTDADRQIKTRFATITSKRQSVHDFGRNDTGRALFSLRETCESFAFYKAPLNVDALKGHYFQSSPSHPGVLHTSYNFEETIS